MAEAKPRVKSAARHDELVQTLNRVTRESSALGTLFAGTVARHFGVSHSDLECIDIILLRGRLTAGELAKQSGLTTGAITGVIDRLEEAGLARRERDASDRRKVYVRILPKTIARGSAYYDSFEKAANALAASYSDVEIALFIDYFTRARDLIRSEIEKLNAKPPPRRGVARTARSPRR